MGTSSRFWLPKYWYISTASTNSCSVYPKSLAAWPITSSVASLMCTLGSGIPGVPSLELLSKYFENLLVLGILALHVTAFLIISFTFSSWYPSTEVLRVTSPTMSEELVSGALLLLLLYVGAGQWCIAVAVIVCRGWFVVGGLVLVCHCRSMLWLFVVVRSCVSCLHVLCLKVWVIILTFIVGIMYMHLTDFFGLKQCLGLDYFHLVCQCSITLIVSSF